MFVFKIIEAMLALKLSIWKRLNIGKCKFNLQRRKLHIDMHENIQICVNMFDFFTKLVLTSYCMCFKNTACEDLYWTRLSSIDLLHNECVTQTRKCASVQKCLENMDVINLDTIKKNKKQTIKGFNSWLKWDNQSNDGCWKHILNIQ